MHEEKVRVAGLITIVRPYTTKTGKAMGFVTIEDIQGTIELVLFTRTWERHRANLKEGQIIISESSYEKVKESFNCNKVGEVSLKNKSHPVMIYEVLD